MMAAFAELERHMIHQRTMAGAAAGAQGHTGGRPTVMNPDTLAAARARPYPLKISPALPRPLQGAQTRRRRAAHRRGVDQLPVHRDDVAAPEHQPLPDRRPA